MDDAGYLAAIEEFLGSDGMSRPTPSQWQELSSRIHYMHGDVTSQADLADVRERLAAIEGDNTACHRLYYLSLAPFLYEPAINGLGEAGMADDTHGWRRLVVEKPFGTNVASARELNDIAHSVFREDQVFRIDHYLGKETVQNLLVFRFANSIFEPIWNRNFIDHVQITVAETLRIVERGEYYDHTGVLRDMFQNHLLQLLTLVAMEPPHAFEAEALRNEKVKVLNAIRRIHAEDVARHAIPGQYRTYRDEPGVSPESETATYAACACSWTTGGGKGSPSTCGRARPCAASPPRLSSSFATRLTCFSRWLKTRTSRPTPLPFSSNPTRASTWSFRRRLRRRACRCARRSWSFTTARPLAARPSLTPTSGCCWTPSTETPPFSPRGDEIEQAWSIVDPVMRASPAPVPPSPTTTQRAVGAP